MVPAQHGQRIAQPQERGNHLRLALERQLEFLDGLLGPACGNLELAQRLARQRIRAIQTQRLLVHLCRFVVTLGGLQRLSQGNPRRHLLRRGSHRGRSHFHGRFGLAAGQRHLAHPHQSRRVRGILLQHALVAARNLRQVAGHASGLWRAYRLAPRFSVL